MALQFESYDGGNFMGNLNMNMLVGTAAEALEAGDFNEVDRVTSIMLKGDISYHVAYKLKGIAFQRMNRELDALVTFEDCLKYHPEDDELWDLVHKSKIEISATEMMGVLAKDDRTAKYYNDPVFLFTKGLKFTADLRANNIRSVDHEDYQIWRDTQEVILGCKLPEFKRGQDIVKEFERLFQNINNRNIERRIGNAFFKANRYQYAIKKYEDALDFDKKDIAVYNNIAMCYYKLGQTEDASNNFDKCRTKCIKALVIGQQHGAQKKDISKAMARIGMCYECEKDYEKAIEWFEKSVAEHPGKDVSIRLAKLKKQHQK